MQTTTRNPIDLAKTLIYSLKHVAEKRSQERRIRKFDENTPFLPFDAVPGLAKHGWAKTNSTSLFGVSLANVISRNEVPTLPEVDDMGNALTRKFTEETLKIILESSALTTTVMSYLGSEARLDDMYLWKKDTDLQGKFDISEGWHTDNVGNRLKVYIGVEASPAAPKTVLIPDTHKFQYRVAMSEFARFFGKVGTPSQDQEPVEIHYEPDIVALFDTNAIHRGQYDGTKASRTCLVIEFINRRKGNELSGRCPCGPGQRPEGRLTFPKTMWEILNSHTLIDRNLLKDEACGVSYSISNIGREII